MIMQKYEIYRIKQKLLFKNLPFTENVLLLQHPYEILTRHEMIITVIQNDVKWACPDYNMTAAEALIANAPQSDLYVLPEMWATGFMTADPAGACSAAPLEWMQHTAERRCCAVSGSLAVRAADGTFRNRHYFVMPDGSFYYYDKHHLFTYGGEDRHYTAGRRRVVAEYKGVRFLLQTCYDLRFPVWMRYRDDYDAIIFAANWPASRQTVWQTLLRARAMENQCYVIGANRTGSDPAAEYSGGSAIIDAKGATLAEAAGTAEQAVTAEISLDELRRFRAKFPVLADRDRF